MCKKPTNILINGFKDILKDRKFSQEVQLYAHKILNSYYSCLYSDCDNVEYGLKDSCYDVVYSENPINNDLLRKKWMDDIKTGITAKGKVYCSDCRWYLTRKQKHNSIKLKKIGAFGDIYTTPCSECSYPDNVCEWYDNSLAEPNIFIEKPEVINGYNNCMWYKKKRCSTF